jgi:hypothetical protein
MAQFHLMEADIRKLLVRREPFTNGYPIQADNQRISINHLDSIDAATRSELKRTGVTR